jgi:hypothetical protein
MFGNAALTQRRAEIAATGSPHSYREAVAGATVARRKIIAAGDSTWQSTVRAYKGLQINLLKAAGQRERIVETHFDVACTSGGSLILSGRSEPPSFAKVRFLIEHEPPDRKIEFVEFPVLGGHATNPHEYAEYADIDHPVGNSADPSRPYPDVSHRALPGSYAKLPNGAPSTVLNSDFTLNKLAKDFMGLGAYKPFLADKIHPTELFARRFIQIAVSTVLTYEEALLPEDQVPIIIVIADGWNHKTRTREAYRDFRRALRNITTVW